MKDVGEFEKRNKEFDLKFSREIIIKKSVQSDKPIIFDIGAHHGESIDYLTSIFPVAEIFSFEPDPESFNILSKKNLNNAKIYNLALTDKTGVSNFYRNKITHTNSLYRVNLKSKDSIKFSQKSEDDKGEYEQDFNTSIEVLTMTLDQFTKEHSIDNIDLIKIDVQGAEESVLSGGKDSINNASAIIIEVSFYDYYEKSTSFIDIERYLIPLGFKIFGILDISRNPMNGRTDWVEVLYIKD
jgi:FkbM family methyltransferase